jgi:hypothetical protein
LNLLGQAPTDDQALEIRRHHHLTLVHVADNFNLIADTQPHAQQAQAGRGPSGKTFDFQPLAPPGIVQGNHDIAPVQTLPADAIEFHPVLEQVKTTFGGDLNLKLLYGLILKLKDAFAFGANHVVVVLAKVMVLIAGLAVVEQVLPGKPIVAHQVNGIANKFQFQSRTLGLDQVGQFLGRHMVFGGQENLQHYQPVFESIDSILLEKLYELLFFLLMDCLCSHGNASSEISLGQRECPGRFQVVHDPPEQVRVWVEACCLAAPTGAILKLVELNMRSNSSDPHLVHFICTWSSLAPITRISTYSWHLRHLNSKIGIIDS